MVKEVSGEPTNSTDAAAISSCCCFSARSRRRRRAGVTPISLAPFKSVCECDPLTIECNLLTSSIGEEESEDDELHWPFSDLSAANSLARRFKCFLLDCAADRRDSNSSALESPFSSDSMSLMPLPFPVMVCSSWNEFNPKIIELYNQFSKIKTKTPDKISIRLFPC